MSEPSHPHTLTPSHPHTLTPSHPHTLTPSHVRTTVRVEGSRWGLPIRLLGKAVFVCWAKHSSVRQSCIRLLGKEFVSWAKMYSSVGQSIRLLGKAV